MKTNVTKISPKYPLGEEPDYIDPLDVACHAKHKKVTSKIQKNLL